MMRNLFGLPAFAVVAGLFMTVTAAAYPIEITPPWADKEPSPIKAPERPSAIVPADRWEVEGANGRCIASRRFGDPADPITISFKTVLFSGVSVIIIEPQRIRNSLPPLLQQRETGAFVSNERVPKFTTMRIARLKDGKQVTNFSMKRDAFLAMRAAGELWTYSKNHNRYVKLPAMDDVGKLLDSCEEALAESLGLPVAEQRRLAVLPVEKSGKPVFNTNDYPRGALIQNKGASTVVAVMVEADGQASRCHIVDRSNVPELDQRTCTVLMKRARFSPAVDTAGRAVRALSPVRVTWLIG